MLELLSVLQTREADRLAIAGGVPGVVLMENAGAAVARAVMARWTKRRVIVLCGPGNNGGDGFVAARHLAAAGWKVRLGLLGDRAALAGDAAHHAALWRGEVAQAVPALLEGAGIVIDALFGSGLTRPLDNAASALLRAAAGSGAALVAIDVPSGVQGDTGESLGAVACDLTVTFFRKKPGHVLLPGRTLCGEVSVAAIGITGTILPALRCSVTENRPALWHAAFPVPQAAGNKYTRGHAVVFGGKVMTGAARMAAQGAARAGAGLVTVAVPPGSGAVYGAALTSIMVRELDGDDALAALIEDQRLNALLIGPGAGVGAATRTTALALLRSGRAVLLDADAITAFKEDPAALFSAIHGSCVLTPHDGEFKRLFSVTGDRLTRALAAARESGAVVVLKGADTVVASPDGRASINGDAPPTLATAGAGDVLGGIILGLLAQGMEPFLAASAGVWMHGAAAATIGPGLMAEDLPDALPVVLRRLETERKQGLLC